MSLNKIQREWYKLNSSRPIRLLIPSRLGGFRYRKNKKGKKNDIHVPKSVKVEIINAITGEKTTARSYDDSQRKLTKWLKLKNARAQFNDMVINKKSTFNVLTAEELKGYPVIVKVGTYKLPYVIDHVGDRYIKTKKTMCILFLKTVSNLDFLSIVNEKTPLIKKAKKK